MIDQEPQAQGQSAPLEQATSTDGPSGKAQSQVISAELLNADNIGDPPKATGVEPSGTLAPISGFWRRIGAWLVDGILIAIFAQAVGFVFQGFFFQIGPYGRLLFFFFTLAYFSILDSKIGNGQTLGKRLLGISVRNAVGKPISLGRAAARDLIWLLPLFFNGWTLPQFQRFPLLLVFSTIIVFGLGAAIAYTMIFNRATRQGLQDMLLGTYVVKLKGPLVAVYPQTRRVHWYVATAILGLSAVLGIVGFGFQNQLQNATGLGDLVVIYNLLGKDERFFSVSVFDRQVSSTSSPTPAHVLDVEVWVKGLPSDEERIELMNQVARVTLDNHPNLERFELLRIGIRSQYDLGIASGHVIRYSGEPIEVWRGRLE